MSLPGQVGWLTVPGTDIAGLLMQVEDNDYYLRRNEAGQDDVWGCYFMDYECGTESQNYIVYGHSLDDSPDEARFSNALRICAGVVVQATQEESECKPMLPKGWRSFFCLFFSVCKRCIWCGHVRQQNKASLPNQ